MSFKDAQEWAAHCAYIKEKHAKERDPFLRKLRQANWAIRHSWEMVRDEKRREIVESGPGYHSVRTGPPDEITKALWKRIGYPEKARGDL